MPKITASNPSGGKTPAPAGDAFENAKSSMAPDWNFMAWNAAGFAC